MPHIFWGSIWLGFLGRGAAFWNWEREPHDKQGLASLRTGRDDDYTLDDLFLFLYFCLPLHLTISRKLHSSQMHDFMTLMICGNLDCDKIARQCVTESLVLMSLTPDYQAP